MNNKQNLNVGVDEIFTNFSKDPCLQKSCKNECPVGFTCIRAVPPRVGEFRLDFSECNFRCPFCWTNNKPLSLNPENVHKGVKCRFQKFNDSNLNVNISYLRITGGEPLLNENRIAHLLTLFRLIDEDLNNHEIYKIWKKRKSPPNIKGRKNIKIQTNGSTITNLKEKFIEKIKDYKNLAFTFEISLKGINSQEFNLLSGGLPEKIFSTQIQAIKELISYEKKGYPIFTRAILGIYHSEQNDLIFPDDGLKMMLNPSDEFINIVKLLRTMPRNQNRFYVEPLRFTTQMITAKEKSDMAGILSKSEIGLNIKPGKKIPLNKTPIGELIN